METTAVGAISAESFHNLCPEVAEPGGPGSPHF